MNLLQKLRLRRAGAEPVLLSPRAAAVELVREHIAAGRAGLDPYEPSDLLFDAHADELVWSAIALNYVGVILNRRDREGGVRFRVVVEADVRDLLGLDLADAPTMDDEPLASRGVGSEARAAIRRAHDAWLERYPNGIQEVH